MFSELENEYTRGEKFEPMTESEIRNLLNRYQQGLCTPEEKQMIDRWLESESNAPAPFPTEAEKIRIKNKLQAAIYKNAGLPEKSRLTISEGSESYTNSFTATKSWGIYRIAASLVLLAVVGYGAFRYLQPDEIISTPIAQDIKAGGDKAILKLADGTQVELNGKGTVIPQQGVATVINQNGKLSYVSQLAKANESVINTVSTPRGGQYQLTLADGSKVWLNAASSLKFPAAFSGNERVVELTGEAYFEVAHNKEMPFKVRIPSGEEVTVLGTHFNVMAYTEEELVKTTLLEGSVRVTSKKGNSILAPNQQALMTKQGDLSVVRDYNVDEAVAWKNGSFVFNDTELEVIMRQVARWYDVEVVYENDLRDLQFGGVVSRKENVSAVLNLLELTSAVDFEIQEKKIIVKSIKK